MSITVERSVHVDGWVLQHYIMVDNVSDRFSVVNLTLCNLDIDKVRIPRQCNCICEKINNAIIIGDSDGKLFNLTYVQFKLSPDFLKLLGYCVVHYDYIIVDHNVSILVAASNIEHKEKIIGVGGSDYCADNFKVANFKTFC